jgi:hypothetical protein
MRTSSRIVAGFAAAVLWALPAVAQSAGDLSAAQQNEMYCVQGALAGSDAAYDLSDAYLVAFESDEGTLKAADAVLQKYIDVCVSKYGWDTKKAELAGTIGLHRTVVQVLNEDLIIYEGLEDEDIDNVFAEVRKLSHAELDILYAGAWRTDDAFRERVAMRLIAGGFPDDDFLIEDAMALMEAAVIAAVAESEWVALVKK